MISDSLMALRNDEREMLAAFNPEKVRIEPTEAPTGMMSKYKVTVNVPTHYLEDNELKNPIPTNSIVFYVEVLNGYPKTKPRVYYPSGKRLASVNVFAPDAHNRMRCAQCTDEWYPKTSSLFLLVEKTVRDIIHDPSVCRYDSMANTSLETWHKENVKNKRFPTVDPAELYRKNTVELTTSTKRIPPLPEVVSISRRQIPPPVVVR